MVWYTTGITVHPWQTPWSACGMPSIQPADDGACQGAWSFQYLVHEQLNHAGMDACGWLARRAERLVRHSACMSTGAITGRCDTERNGAAVLGSRHAPPCTAALAVAGRVAARRVVAGFGFRHPSFCFVCGSRRVSHPSVRFCALWCGRCPCVLCLEPSGGPSLRHAGSAACRVHAICARRHLPQCVPLPMLLRPACCSCGAVLGPGCQFCC